MLTNENILYAILPSILGIIVYKSDKNREPFKRILYAFSLGVFFQKTKSKNNGVQSFRRD